MSGNILAGDLASVPLADVMMLLHNAGKTGALRCTRADVAKTIDWKKGEIVFARSSMREDRLDAYLLTRGTITEQQLRDAEGARGDERLGTMLVRHGILTEPHLKEAVKGHVSEIVYSLFHWEDGAFEFWEGDLPAEDIVLETDVLNLILEGARRLDEWTQVREKIQSDQVVLSPVKTVSEVSSVANLSDVECDVLVLVDGRHTVREVVDAAGHSEFDVWQALHTLLSAGLLRTQMIAFDAAEPDQETDKEEESIQLEIVRFERALMRIMDRLRRTEDQNAERRLRRRLREATFKDAHVIRELAIEPDGRINKRVLLANLEEDTAGTGVRQVQASLESLLQFVQQELAGKVEFDDILAELASRSRSTSG